MSPLCDVLAPYRREWRVTGFRDHLKTHEGFSFNPDSEGQQQNLRVYFGGIHAAVWNLLSAQIGKLNYWLDGGNLWFSRPRD